MEQRNTRFPADLAAAFDWWRGAGVDLDFVDDATDWLGELAAEEPAEVKPAPRHETKAAQPEPVAKKADLLGPEPPKDLAAFREWWLTEPGLDPIGPRGRVAPRGDAGAKVMVLVADPEQGDAERLLSQAQGRLLARMLEAMKLAETEVYFASVLPRHTPMADGDSLLASGYREVMLHHVSLVSPERIIAFGANILPLLGHNAAQDPKSLREINHDGGDTPILASEGLDSMLAMPRLKARFWRRWLEWTDDTR